MLPQSSLTPFGEWLPDQGEFNNPGAIFVNNVMPDGENYRPFPVLGELSDALPARCLGAFQFKTDAGVLETFAGTATKLYRFAGGAWTDVTRTSGGDYAVPSEQFWRFAALGDDIIATNYVDDMQVFTVGTSTNFAALTGTPPRCRDMAVIANFLVTINIVDPVDGDKAARVRWSGLANATSWTVSATTQADFQDILSQTGEGRRIIPFRDYGLLLFDNEIWRMRYVGPPAIFQIEKVSDTVGCQYPASAVEHNGVLYFLNSNGFQAFDGARVLPIGDGKIDDYFKSVRDINDAWQIVGAINPEKNMVVWSYGSASNSLIHPDKMIAYHYPTGRWCQGDVPSQYILNGFTTAVSVDALDGFYSSIDDIPFSLDSAVWAGGSGTMVGFTGANKLGYADGIILPAVLETREIRPNPSGKAFVSSVQPIVDDIGNPNVTVKYRDAVTDSLSSTPKKALFARTQESHFSKTSRYFRAVVETNGNWSLAQGVKYRSKDKGNW